MLTIYRPYIHCSAGRAISAVETISQAIETLQAWMWSNSLRLNPTKTQFIWFGTRQQLATIDLGLLATKYQHFTFSSSVRDTRPGAYICPSYKSPLPQWLLPTSATPSLHLLPLPLFTPLWYLASITVAPYTKGSRFVVLNAYRQGPANGSPSCGPHS